MHLFFGSVFFSGSFVKYIHMLYSSPSKSVNQELLLYYRCAAITTTNPRTFRHPRGKPHAHNWSSPGPSQPW